MLMSAHTTVGMGMVVVVVKVLLVRITAADYV